MRGRTLPLPSVQPLLPDLDHQAQLGKFVEVWVECTTHGNGPTGHGCKRIAPLIRLGAQRCAGTKLDEGT